MEKIVLHAHSLWSHDSRIALQEWRDFLIDNRINKVFLTEHEESGWDAARYVKYMKECKRYSTADYKIIPGLELNIRGYHVLAPGLLDYGSKPSDENLRELKNWVVKNGSFLIAAHPDKYASYDPEVLAICDGIEIINTKHQYNWFFTRPTLRTFDFKRRYGLMPFIGQDIHRLSQYTSSGLMTMHIFDLSGFHSKLCQRTPLFLNDLMIKIKNIMLDIYMKIKKAL